VCLESLVPGVRPWQGLNPKLPTVASQHEYMARENWSLSNEDCSNKGVYFKSKSSTGESPLVHYTARFDYTNWWHFCEK